MRFEDILDDVGGFSRFQCLTLCILCLPRAILPLHFLLHNFISATPPHHCAPVPPESSGGVVWLAADHEALRVPFQNNGSLGSCGVDDSPQTLDLRQGNRTVPCPHGWIYDKSQFVSTTATEVQQPRELQSRSLSEQT